MSVPFGGEDSLSGAARMISNDAPTHIQSEYILNLAWPDKGGTKKKPARSRLV
jgi:hypothetical protein